MFLFNKARTSRQNYATGNEIIKINWKTYLNTNPNFGAESTAVFDSNNNIYFGSHSGNFYSLNSEGKIRWVFTTKVKIYSSPILLQDKIIFSGGDGFVYCLGLEGKLIWKYNLSRDYKNESKLKKIISFIVHLPFTYSFKRKKNIIYRSWSSPNFIGEKILVTGFGEGLVCLNLSGQRLWSNDWGFPRYQLTGVAIHNNRIYGSSRKGNAYCISDNGNLIWEKKIKRFWEPWGNPVVCSINKLIFYFFSWKESSGVIAVFDFNGKSVWKNNYGAIRGSCAVDRTGDYIFFCDFDGYIYKVQACTGKLVAKLKLTNCKRGLWITPTIDINGDILISTKDGNKKGRIIKLNQHLKIIWEFNSGKVLSIPLLNKKGDVLFGSWDGYYYSLKTK